jgi:hypothetical protein
MLEQETVNLSLKAAIVRKFGTQLSFCATTQEHPTVVSAIVRGRRKISEAKRRRWAQVLGADVEELFPKASK